MRWSLIIFFLPVLAAQRETERPCSTVNISELLTTKDSVCGNAKEMSINQTVDNSSCILKKDEWLRIPLMQTLQVTHVAIRKGVFHTRREPIEVFVERQTAITSEKFQCKNQWSSDTEDYFVCFHSDNNFIGYCANTIVIKSREMIMVNLTKNQFALILFSKTANAVAGQDRTGRESSPIDDTSPCSCEPVSTVPPIEVSTVRPPSASCHSAVIPGMFVVSVASFLALILW